MKAIPTDIEIEVKDIDIIVSRANEAGDITYANQIFYKISGYSQVELTEQPHSILRHPDMPKVIFKYLWHNLKQGKSVIAFVKNLTKSGSFYWVLADVKVTKNSDGSIRNFVSTRKVMTAAAKALIVPLYKQMIEAEKEEGIDASLNILKEFIKLQGGSMETFNDTMKTINKQ